MNAIQQLLDSSDDVLELELADALAESGAIFACSLQSAVRFELAHDDEIETTRTAIPRVVEILDVGKEEQRRRNLRSYFVSLLKNEGFGDPPVEFAQAARNLQSALPGNVQRKMAADRQKAEANDRD